MSEVWQSITTAAVALLAEGVDRNDLPEVSFIDNDTVALLAEGVDRNVDVD